jgi:MFS transporter, PAT family, beta-lactamase induction signal transducer AmpG
LFSRLITALVLGINSGLVYALLGSTFTAYLDEMHVHLITIGFLTLRFLPYQSKPLWAPIVDNVGLPFFPVSFGQRKSWMIATQCILIICIITLGSLDINQYFSLVCCMAVLTAFFAATYDIAMEAYRIELFKKNQLNKGSSFVVYGFRIGLITSGSFGLYLSSLIGWQWTFITMAALIIPCMIVVLFSKDTKKIPRRSAPIKFKQWFVSSFLHPIVKLYRIPNFYIVFLLVAFYKMSDGYLDAMLIPFLFELGFTKAQIAGYATSVMIIASLMGTYIGSYFITRYSMIKNLLCAELLAATTNLTFITLAVTGSSGPLLSCVAFIESFCSGVCNIILINYMSVLCHRKFTATHYAILISISGLTRTLLASTSGLVVTEAGWINFFIISAFLSVPSLFCIYLLQRSAKVLPK